MSQHGRELERDVALWHAHRGEVIEVGEVAELRLQSIEAAEPGDTGEGPTLDIVLVRVDEGPLGGRVPGLGRGTHPGGESLAALSFGLTAYRMTEGYSLTWVTVSAILLSHDLWRLDSAHDSQSAHLGRFRGRGSRAYGLLGWSTPGEQRWAILPKL